MKLSTFNVVKHVSGSPTVLLVEDNELVMDMTRDMLESSGYRVVSTFLPNVALEMVEKGDVLVDLLLTDVVMPQMNGPEMYRRMQQLQPGIPVLYMSGYSRRAIKGVMLGEKVVFLPKPFSLDMLLERIGQILAPDKALALCAGGP